MIYRDFQDLKLSALGMGAMRLPVVEGDDARIDVPAAQAMVDYADAQGYRLDQDGPRHHHEIYLSDPRRCKPENQKTVLRLPVKPK